jgi:putative tryptophan/tyrosine transport system substrate-binding protein
VNRREFIAGLGATVLPVAARAQQPTMSVIGFLCSGSQHSDAFRLAAFWRGLNETGYLDGRNVTAEYRWADDQYSRLPALAAQLVARQPAVIATIGGTAPALAAKAATTTIPVVFAIAGDPVGLGLVASLSRPGGNVTGVTTLAGQIVAKQLEVLHELVPQATAIGCLVNRNSPDAEVRLKQAQEAARILGLQLHVQNAAAERDIDTAFATLVQRGAGGVVVVSDASLNSLTNKIAAVAVRYALPTVHSLPEFTAAGGLLTYGNSVIDSYRQAGLYAGRILKGDKPANLPAIQATKVELIINLKTAKTLGITFPITLLGRADEVIE